MVNTQQQNGGCAQLKEKIEPSTRAKEKRPFLPLLQTKCLLQ
jgi:hypothetical protein